MKIKIFLLTSFIIFSVSCNLADYSKYQYNCEIGIERTWIQIELENWDAAYEILIKEVVANMLKLKDIKDSGYSPTESQNQINTSIMYNFYMIVQIFQEIDYFDINEAIELPE